MDRVLKRQQITVGSIVKIPLANGFHGYGRILDSKTAIYEIYTRENLPEKEILESPILFFVAVFDSVITKGYWEKIGKPIPLEEKLKNENLPPMYKQDLATQKCELVYPDRFEPATEEQCKGLERWSVWTAQGIEQRLEKHFASKEKPVLEKDLELV